MIFIKERLQQIVSPLKPFDGGRGNFIINCPVCGHRECGISYTKANHPWGCYRKKKCGAEGNIYDIAKYLAIELHYKKDILVNEELQNISVNSLSPQQELLSLPKQSLPLGYQRVFQNDYLDSRGFIDKDYHYWQVGKTSLLSSLKKYCIFPIYCNDEVKAYVARREVEGDPKYNNSKNDFASLLGGWDKVTPHTETAIICEGKLDIINVNRLLDLYDCEQIRPLCTFGAKLSVNQLNLLLSSNIKNIILFFDDDVIQKIKTFAFELDLYFNTQVTTIRGDNDPGDCNFSQLQFALDNTQSPVEFFINRL